MTESDPPTNPPKKSCFSIPASQVSFFCTSSLSACVSPLVDDTGSPGKVLGGLGFVAFCGIALGLAFPENFSESGAQWMSFVSAILGYTYTVAWSLSFYPQIVLNFRRRSTVGLSVDFLWLNVLGFGCYSVYVSAFYWNVSIQSDYASRHDGHPSAVRANDVVFAIHALITSAVTLGQVVWYDDERLGLWVASVGTRVFVVVSLLVTAVYAIALGVSHDTTAILTWMDFLYFLTYIKMMVSLIKYVPQAYLNYRRQSTSGWNIWNILLDFTGGIFSLLQLILDCWNIGDYSGISGDLIKLFLSLTSIFFDVLFIIQHYVLYWEGDAGYDPLINTAVDVGEA